MLTYWRSFWCRQYNWNTCTWLGKYWKNPKPAKQRFQFLNLLEIWECSVCFLEKNRLILMRLTSIFLWRSFVFPVPSPSLRRIWPFPAPTRSMLAEKMKLFFATATLFKKCTKAMFSWHCVFVSRHLQHFINFVCIMSHWRLLTILKTIHTV